MITQKQIKDLAKYYQIDEFTIFREYLQLLFLSYLYQQKQSTKIYFKGGTAVHFLFNSPRFSEDLDFSIPYDKKQINKFVSLRQWRIEIKEILKAVKKEIERELPKVKLSILYQGKKSIRFRLKYKSEEFKYPLVLRLDFSQEKNVEKIITSSLISKFPLVFFPIISHLSAEEILAEKIRAFLIRGKGRDVFDLWFLLKKGIKIDNLLVENKLKAVKRKFNKDKLVKKIKAFPLKKLELDLNKFLPLSQRRIVKILKNELINQLDYLPNQT